MAKIIFICTSNADRSVALERYFREKYPQHEYRSAGINEYHTTKKGTHLVNQDDVDWADLIVYAEDVHRDKISKWVSVPADRNFIVLNSGKYEKGNVSAEYLLKSDRKLQSILHGNNK